MSRLRLSDLNGAGDYAPVDVPDAGRFTRVIPLSFPTGGDADTASVAAGAILNSRFQSRTVNALDTSAPEAASLSKSGSDLIVTLPIAREIRYVLLNNPQDGDRIAAYRFDGDVVSDDAVETATHGTSGARLDVTDAQLILRRVNGSEFSLNTGDIDGIDLRYTPGNPRLALRYTDASGTTTVPFAVDLDTEGTPQFPNSAAYGIAFEPAMAALLGGLPSPLPDPLEIDLVMIADQPCEARLDAFDVTLNLEANGFTEKQVLRFSGRNQTQEALTLTLPPGAALAGGLLSVTVAGSPPGPEQQAAPSQPMPASTGEGLRLSQMQPAATQINLDAAQTLIGAEFLLAAPDGAAEARALLLADADGLPGAALAESIPHVIDRATPVPVAFTFAPTPVPSGLLWLGIMPLAGDIIALLGGAQPVALGGGATFTLLPVASGLAATLRPISTPDTAPPSGPQLTIANAAPIDLPTAGTTQIDLADHAAALALDPAVSVTSTARAIVTLDPPRLHYTLP